MYIGNVNTSVFGVAPEVVATTEMIRRKQAYTYKKVRNQTPATITIVQFIL